MAEEATRPRTPQQTGLRRNFDSEAEYRAYFRKLAQRPRSGTNKRKQLQKMAVALDSLSPAQRDVVLALLRAGEEAAARQQAHRPGAARRRHDRRSGGGQRRQLRRLALRIEPCGFSATPRQ